jgi:hypothetical protein
MMQVEKIVAPWVSLVIDEPLPYVEDSDASFYQAIEAGRAETATGICADMLRHVKRIEGEAAVEQARADLEPIRRDLARRFPHVIALLDPDAWPAVTIQ